MFRSVVTFWGACILAACLAVPAQAGARAPATSCLARCAAVAPEFGAPEVLPADAPVPYEVPGRLGAGAPDLLPSALEGDRTPNLVLAQRAITRDLPGAGANGPEPPYTYVDVPGWKSPGQAGSMSLVLPGSGQLYAGSSRGFVFLGVEALALLSYAKFTSDRNDKRDEYFRFVGDPNDPASRFNFDRFAGSISDPAEVARLREIYQRDPREFYDLVSHDDKYSGGWTDPAQTVDQARAEARGLADDSNRLGQKARIGLFTALANHLASAADALHLARLNNIALQDHLSLKLKVRPAGNHSQYAMTLIRKF